MKSLAVSIVNKSSSKVRLCRTPETMGKYSGSQQIPVKFLIDSFSNNSAFNFRTKRGCVKKTLTFDYWSRNYSLGEAAGWADILYPNVTDGSHASNAGRAV